MNLQLYLLPATFPVLGKYLVLHERVGQTVVLHGPPPASVMIGPHQDQLVLGCILRPIGSQIVCNEWIDDRSVHWRDRYFALIIAERAVETFGAMMSRPVVTDNAQGGLRRFLLRHGWTLLDPKRGPDSALVKYPGMYIGFRPQRKAPAVDESAGAPATTIEADPERVAKPKKRSKKTR